MPGEEEIPNVNEYTRTTPSFETEELLHNKEETTSKEKKKKKHTQYQEHFEIQTTNEDSDKIEVVHDSDSDKEEDMPEQDSPLPNDAVIKFKISPENWSRIQPITKTYWNGRIMRKMNKGWTDIFYDEVRKFHPGCIMRVKKQHVKTQGSRKRNAAFFQASAKCVGKLCHREYSFSILNEPDKDEFVLVYCDVMGRWNHSEDEVNRRKITGKKRQDIGSKIRMTSAAKVFNKNLISANTEELQCGNFTAVPNPVVLRKIVSEIVQKESLHSNILAELHVLKEQYEMDKNQYIRDIGYSPFYLILFSDSQINMIKNLSGNLDLYIDATGSVISKIVGQKRPYLYSMVVKPNANIPPVSVADMITTQHTIPRIELFLLTVKRAVNSKGKSLQINKIETDYSLALIQACLHVYNNMYLKEYLVKCMDILRERTVPDGFTVHHLCASHMIRDLSRQLSKSRPKIKSALRHFILQTFTALQNAISLKELKIIFENCSIVLGSQNSSEIVRTAVEYLQQKFMSTLVIVEEEDDENEKEEIEMENTVQIENKTIREASPFSPIFEEIASISVQTGSIASDSEVNASYCPEALRCLVEKFMPIVPLWSGIMLRICASTSEQTISRDTTSPVENWFKYVKGDLKIPKHARPYRFVTELREATDSRVKLHTFPGSRKAKKTNKRKDSEADYMLNTAEEIWKPKKRKRNIYHPPTKIREIPKSRKKGDEFSEHYPEVMKWGGTHANTTLDNTCTIDNVLTILHLKYLNDTRFTSNLEKESDLCATTLLTVFALMDRKESVEAKIVWLDYIGKTIKPSLDLFGDESDYVSAFLSRWKSYTTSTCNGMHCEDPLIESREMTGAIMSMADAFDGIQSLVENWMEHKEPCEKVVLGSVCQGSRTLKRRVSDYQLIFVARIYEHCLYDRLTMQQVLKSDSIQFPGIQGQTHAYSLAGITLLRDRHYTAIVISAQFGPLWYDGLAGRLTKVPKDIDSWLPVHAYYCKV